MRTWGRVAALVVLAGAPSGLRAETLADAISLAYQTNPRLQQTRADQRALDEGYVQARAGYRPTVGVQVTATGVRTDFGRPSTQFVNDGSGNLTVLQGAGHFQYSSGSAQLTATQPLYTGGRTAAAVSAAEADILAGREGLRDTEAAVLRDVVTAFEDVRRDQEVVAIRRDNLRVLQGQLEETQAKFEVGQLTRTDTAQAQAQLAAARAQLTSALSQLQISRANYTALVGQNPGDLAAPPTLPGLPATVDEAFDIAERGAAPIGQARQAEQAQRFRVAQARAERRPTLSAQAALGYTGSVAPFDARDYDRALSGTLVFNQPLFTGGLTSSQVRQARERETSARIAVEAARRGVVQTVSQAWNTMLAAHDNVASTTQQVSAAEVAFEGIQEQYRVGLSTTLDVLIQQQTLRDAQLARVTAAHDEYVAQASLLAAMGRLEAGALLQDASRYDAAASFERVKRASSVPWEGGVEALDRIGAPRAERGLEERPAIPAAALPARAPALVPAAPVPARAPPSTVSPTAPVGR